MGIFALHNIPKGSIVTVYLGHFIDQNVESVYSISNGSVILDCDAWLKGDPYLGAHIANDPNWLLKEEERINDFNATIGERFEYIAEKDITSGEEILVYYNLVMEDVKEQSVQRRRTNTQMTQQSTAATKLTINEAMADQQLHALYSQKEDNSKRATTVNDKSLAWDTPLSRIRLDSSRNHHLQYGKFPNARCSVHCWVGIETEKDTFYCPGCNVNMCIVCHRVFHIVPNLIAMKGALKRKYLKDKNKNKTK